MPSDAAVSVRLRTLQWRLVIASLDAARANINDDIRLNRPSRAGLDVLATCLAELKEIRNIIAERVDGGTDAAG